MDRSSLRIAVIGADPSGIATGHELLEKGFTQFTTFEKAPNEKFHQEGGLHEFDVV